MEGLTEGLTVHYREHPWTAFDINARPTSHLAAIIAHVVSQETGEVVLAAFDFMGKRVIYRTALYSHDKTFGTWHWIEEG